MKILVDIPDSLARQLKGEEDAPQQVREALAVEGYRSGALTRGQVAEALGMSFYEAEALRNNRYSEFGHVGIAGSRGSRSQPALAGKPPSRISDTIGDAIGSIDRSRCG
jgi:hypothetical protein